MTQKAEARVKTPSRNAERIRQHQNVAAQRLEMSIIYSPLFHRAPGSSAFLPLRHQRKRISQYSGTTPSAAPSNSALVLRKAALAGLGIGYLPLYCIEDDLKRGALRRLLPNCSPPQKPIYVVYSPAARIPERVRTFVDFLPQWFGRTARSPRPSARPITSNPRW